jgi:hypothetical protein
MGRRGDDRVRAVGDLGERQVGVGVVQLGIERAQL